MRIGNNSTSVVVRSFALAQNDKGENVLVWLEIAPQHPKQVGAIWASLVNGTKELLSLRTDDDKSLYVHGLHRRYHKLTMDAPRIAARARPRFLRLVAPEAIAIQKRGDDFVALEWPGRTIGQTLAAMLEKGTPYPIQIGWGDYLLREAVTREVKDMPCARRLVTGGPAPQGYFISGKTPWGEIISQGVKAGQISLREAQAKVDAEAPLPKGKVASGQRQAQSVPA